MNLTKSKFVSAALMLVVSVVMLVVGSVAWFTISTNPEITGMQVSLYTARTVLISNEKDGEYTETLNLNNAFKDYAPLKPVSTIDGVNWFLPTYYATGELKPASDFILYNIPTNEVAEDFVYHSNVKLVDNMNTPLTGSEFKKASDNGYFVYADFYLKTEEDEVKVRLSVPRFNKDEKYNLSDSITDKANVYGSYVLSNYEKNADGKYVLSTVAQSVMRVGFLKEEYVITEDGSIDTNEDGTKKLEEKFVIYEPNCNMHENIASKPVDDTTTDKDDNGAYVLGYQKTTDTDFENKYVPTRPIELNSENKGQVSDIDLSNVIIQSTSYWKDASVKKKIADQEPINSNDVQTFGKFVKDNDESNLIATSGTSINDDMLDIASNTLVTTLYKDTPKHIRMFIWLEGQDVDCWNDIATGSFKVNLEFAGETIKPRSEDNEETQEYVTVSN